MLEQLRNRTAETAARARVRTVQSAAAVRNRASETAAAARDQAAKTASHASVAYHGVHAAATERRLDRTEAATDRLDHEAAYLEALGAVATEVVVDEGAPGMFPDMPPKPPKQNKDEPTTVGTVGAFSGQAQYHRMRSVYRDHGVSNVADAVAFNADPTSTRDIQIPDADLPPQERAQRRKKVTIFDRGHFIDPRDNISIIEPETRRERAAERAVATRIAKIRSGRVAQAKRRSMLGHTGPNHFWRTKLRHFGEGREDRRALRAGRMTAFEVDERRQARTGQMDHGEWRHTREGSRWIKTHSREALDISEGRATRAAKQRDKKIAKRTKLETKIDKRTQKQAAARAKIEEIAERRRQQDDKDDE